MRLRRDSDDGSWRKRYKLLFGRVEDGGVPRGALPPSGALPEWAASWQGAPGQETQSFQDGSWEGGSPLDGQRSPFDVCVTSVIKPREYYWKHASLASATVS